MESNNEELQYLSGFGNEFSSEALPGALPTHNSPQKCPYDLYAEQLSGSSFTMPRGQNYRTWLYRASPSVLHEPFEIMPSKSDLVSDFSSLPGDPNQVTKVSLISILAYARITLSPTVEMGTDSVSC